MEDSYYDIFRIEHIPKDSSEQYISHTCVATMFRRICMNNIPVYCFAYWNDEQQDKITIMNNTTCLNNGFIKHRLSMLPINQKPSIKLLNITDTNILYQEECCDSSTNSKYHLEFNTNDHITDDHRKGIKTKEAYIYTHTENKNNISMTVKNIEENIEEKIFPYNIYFHKIRDVLKETLHIKAITEIGYGYQSGANTPVSNITPKQYENYTDLHIETIRGITQYNPTHTLETCLIITTNMLIIFKNKVDQLLCENMQKHQWSIQDQYLAYKFYIQNESSTIIQFIQNYIIKRYINKSRYYHISYIQPHPLKEDIQICIAVEKKLENDENWYKNHIKCIFSDDIKQAIELLHTNILINEKTIKDYLNI